ncbi:MAG: ketopantoate reductase C-terminal domain-containing protein, partial [Gemmatimonadales bacterium]
ERGSASTASMLRDMERGGPTEAEHVLGDIVARAHEHAIAVPGLEIALTHFRAYEHRRSHGCG